MYAPFSGNLPETLCLECFLLARTCDGPSFHFISALKYHHSGNSLEGLGNEMNHKEQRRPQEDRLGPSARGLSSRS